MDKFPKKTNKQIRDEVESFQARAWFNAISLAMKDDNPEHLEKILQDWHFKKNPDGGRKGTEAWDKYKIGVRLPQDGYGKNGKPLAVVAAEQKSRLSAWVYRHPLWEVMMSPSMTLARAAQLISKLNSSSAKFYIDLGQTNTFSLIDSLAENISLDIWIDWDDKYDAMDHLAANLMFLRIEGLRHLRDRREKCADNIGKSLGPVFNSNWMKSINEELFDWLEQNIWGDLFDQHYNKGDRQAKGWRKSKPKWLTTLEDELLEDVDWDALEEAMDKRRKT